MTFEWWKMLRWLFFLRLTRVAFGYSDTAFNTCLFQSENLSPGERHNLTIPCEKPQSAEFQLSRGEPIPVTIATSHCTTTPGNSELSLMIDSSTPGGTLNLTIFCQNLGPLCYSFTVEPPEPNPHYNSAPYSISRICNSNNSTIVTNTPSPLNPITPGHRPEGAATTGSQSKPTSTGANGQEPSSFGIGTAAQRQQTPVIIDGTSIQTSQGAGTSGQGLGPTTAGAGVHEPPTQSTGTAGQSQSPQSTQASMPIANPTASAGNPPPTRGFATSAPSQTPQKTGEAQVGNAQTPCTCGQ